MKTAVCFLVVMLAVTSTYGAPGLPVNEDDHGDATAPYWKGKLGWILEQIGKFLQQSASSYSSEDGTVQSQDVTVGQIRKVAEMLNKAADAIEKGEKFDLL
uniref:Glycine rich superfamily member n=1 Tax=Rhipicephalus appendiculatus TaxID=34631 RepID=A0A131YH47_RHIAP